MARNYNLLVVLLLLAVDLILIGALVRAQLLKREPEHLEVLPAPVSPVASNDLEG